MKNIKNAMYVPVFLLVSVLIVSCTDFFSTSLAPWAQRDPDSLIPKVTTGNVKDLVRQAANNPDLSLAVLKKIRDAEKKASGGDATALQLAALDAASNATGPVQTMLKHADELQNIDTEDGAKELVVKVIDDMTNLSETGKLLKEIIPDPVADPPGFQAFVDAADPVDLAMAAAMVLLAADAANSPDKADYITNYAPGSSPLAEALAVAAVNKDTDGKMGPAADLLKNLGLAP
jgi:hypothetical protein